MRNNPTSVLIVDDQKFYRSLLEDLLKKEGYKPNSINNGYDAIEEVKKNQHDIVFLDLHMPEIDGMETLKRIKKIKKDQIVLMVTDRIDVITVTRFLKEGAVDYIQKPISDKGLLRALHSAYRKR